MRNNSVRGPTLAGKAMGSACVLLVWASVHSLAHAGVQVEGLQAHHSAGQTFLIFKETDEVTLNREVTIQEFKPIKADFEAKNIFYRIYRSRSAITSTKELALVGVSPALSAWNDRFYGAYPKPEARVPRFAVKDGTELLSAGMGLFVHNPPEAGKAFYAVTVVVNGDENTTLTLGNSLAHPIEESVGRGVPVLQTIEKPEMFQYVEGASLHRYVRWEVPPHTTGGTVPFDYLVAVPPKLAKPVPVGLHLHSWGGTMYGDYGWWFDAEKGALLVATTQDPYDWWTGYHEHIGTDKPLKTPQDWQQGVVRPYTQRRLLAFLDWVESKWEVDKSRIFVAGNSMGGSGALMLMIRHPERFAWALSWVGVHVPKESPTFRSSYITVYGEPEWGVKFEDGTPVWDYFDDAWYLRQHPDANIGFMTFSNGKNDNAIGWEQAVKFLRALQETRQPHFFVWGQAGHNQRAVMPPPGGERTMTIDIRNDQSLPAFTNSSLDGNPGNGDPSDGDPAGQVNGFLFWETDDIVDEPDEWSMTVGVGPDSPKDQGTADVTPRRCQRFQPRAGETYRWTNAAMSSLGKKVVQTGEVVADKWGRVTLARVMIEKSKNRLTIAK